MRGVEVSIVTRGGVGESGIVFFFQAEDGSRVLVRSGGLGNVYKGQPLRRKPAAEISFLRAG